VQTIETLVKEFNERTLEEGELAYLVSRQWLARAQAQAGGGKGSKAPAADSPGPVDNSDIILDEVVNIDNFQDVRLKPGTGSSDFELFPGNAWELLMKWYGIAKGQLPIIRKAHDTSPDGGLPNILFEFHPPVFTVHRLWNQSTDLPVQEETKDLGKKAPTVMCSSSCNAHKFMRYIKTAHGIPLDRKVRFWKKVQKIPVGDTSMQLENHSALSTPPKSPQRDEDAGEWSKLLIEVPVFTQLEKGVDRVELDMKDTTHDSKYNGKSTLAFHSLTVDETLIMDENVHGHQWVSSYVARVSGGKNKPILAKTSGSTAKSDARATNSGRSSPAPAGPLTRGRSKKQNGRTLGCVGLMNLGNTCYMNSGLQCLRSVEELTKYFLTDQAAEELNTDNPIGYNGQLAESYARLMKEMYKDPPPPSVVPRQFKGLVGRLESRFSGYGQQDSQELLAFTLSGLQEDLSRVKKKQYYEKPDSTDEMINNPAAIQKMADEVWDILLKRDDSVIVDLFTGMYKSTLVCPVCDKVSITFDPFNMATLPLPVQNLWNHKVKFVPLNEPPVWMEVDLDKSASLQNMKEFIGVRTGVPADRLFAAEEFKGRFFKIYDETKPVADEIQTGDFPVVYEMESAPTNWPHKIPQGKKYRSLLDVSDDEDEKKAQAEDPLAQNMVVPVFHRIEPGVRTGARFFKKDESPPPHVITLTPQEVSHTCISLVMLKALSDMSRLVIWTLFDVRSSRKWPRFRPGHRYLNLTKAKMTTALTPNSSMRRPQILTHRVTARL